MQVETDEPEIIERVAALDIGKAEVVWCPDTWAGRAAHAGDPHRFHDDRGAAGAG